MNGKMNAAGVIDDPRVGLGLERQPFACLHAGIVIKVAFSVDITISPWGRHVVAGLPGRRGRSETVRSCSASIPSACCCAHLYEFRRKTAEHTATVCTGTRSAQSRTPAMPERMRREET